MVIERFSSHDALGRLSTEGSRVKWPEQWEPEGRLKGLATVSCTPSFNITAQDTIFTMGSCFARNIEKRLTEIGFKIPMRGPEIKDVLASCGHGPDYMNKYNTGSIRAEIGWASQGQLPGEDVLFVNTRDGLAHDLFMTGTGRINTTLEQVREMRQAINRGMQQIRNARIVIITLGLVEVWRDLKSGLQINRAPPPAAAEAEPTRFVLEVLSYEDILSDLEAVHSLLSEHGHPDFKMILTVSPVPVQLTFRSMDALTANTYGKSVLRAAAEAFVFNHANVDYLPSYETVTWTERSIAYAPDNRHVQTAAVAKVVDRFVKLYAPGLDLAALSEKSVSASSSGVADDLLGAKMLVDQRMYAEAVERFEKAFAHDIGDDEKVRHYRIDVDAMRMVFAGSLLKVDRVADARSQLEKVLATDGVRPTLLLKCADLFLAAGSPERADAALRLAEDRGAAGKDVEERRVKLSSVASPAAD